MTVLLTSFFGRYQTEFGFTMPDRKMLVSDVRVRGVGKTEVLEDPTLPSATEPVKSDKVNVYK